jgi:hypothetical protein
VGRWGEEGEDKKANKLYLNYSARSIYVTNNTDCHLAIYNADSCAQGWVNSVQTTPYIAGGFSWTGFDYKVGERGKEGMDKRCYTNFTVEFRGEY